ncbi:universal stress protein [Natrialbaceae archaeon AArc-T1-2]|uniref:universal stress protein n=1 Tax=Natrialbaceae archaeon AArc-T1-2 TaxID=3053904 RepID=UPI00255B347C|nr:universal stress protein [Natrialbaceae archaeon AArc-T1-2]WIV67848.1 universal stress protein [Natrialbaceae archaeon AArc-T1-2]
MATIVAGTDADTNRARALAEGIVTIPGTDDLEAILVHVFDENPDDADVEQVASVRRAREILEDHGVEVTLEGTSGDAAPELIDTADDHDAEMIAVAGRKRSPTGKAIFGSVTQDVVLGTDRPVLVCSAERR